MNNRILAYLIIMLAFACAIRAGTEKEAFGFILGMAAITMVICADLLINNSDAKKQKDSPK